MKTSPSALTPFLRSDAQGAVLAEILLDPEREMSISEIGRRAGLLPAVSHREVTRLIDAAVVKDRREGNNRMVRANTEHPLWPLMSQLVTETYGPVPLLTRLLGAVPGIESAHIYGSWAARRTGEPGPPPRDLDVLVVGTPDRVDLLDVAEAAQSRLRTEVNIRTVTPENWSEKTDPFLSTLAQRPLITIIPTTGEPDA